MGQLLQLRPELLITGIPPLPLSGISPRTLIGRNKWDEIRNAVYLSTDYHCIICGEEHREKWVFASWDGIEAHELYSVDYETGVVQLGEIVPVCRKCHAYIHLRPNWYKGRIAKRERIREVLKWGRSLLKQAGLPYYHEAVRHDIEWKQWRLLYDGKEHTSDFKSLEDMVEYYRKKSG